MFPRPTRQHPKLHLDWLPFFGEPVCKTVCPVLSDRCLFVCPVCRSLCPVSLSVMLVYCGQKVGWIKMKLGMEVGLGPGCIVSRDPAPPPSKGHSLQIFSRCLLWPNGWMDQDATWYGGRPWSRRHYFRWGTQLPLKRGPAPPLFGPWLLWPNGWMN